MLPRAAPERRRILRPWEGVRPPFSVSLLYYIQQAYLESLLCTRSRHNSDQIPTFLKPVSLEEDSVQNTVIVTGCCQVTSAKQSKGRL